MLSLKEYTTIAEKILSKRHKIFISDEVIGRIVHALIQADLLYDNKTGSLEGYRATCVKYEVMKILKSQKKERMKYHHLSDKVYSIVDDTAFIIDDDAAINRILSKAKSILTPNQYECLTAYYLEEKTLEEIGKEKGVTRQAISLTLKKCMEKLRTELKEYED